MIQAQNITKQFRGKASSVLALNSVDLEVQEAELLVLLGPSGSGKTTLLRCVAGLERPDEGEIRLGPRVVSSSARGFFVPPEDRGLGMVFQSYAIWPHMTVFENVALPLTQGKLRLPREEVKVRVGRALARVGMEGLESRPAPLLSGGQQQRVALARALAVEPTVLLMDEPLSNLDARLREEVRREIRSLVREIGVTVLYVTHDQTEAMDLGDRIAVMHQGHILQIGPPEEVYLHPMGARVAEFLGSTNWLPGKLTSSGTVETSIGLVSVDTERAGKFSLGDSVMLVVRPENLELLPEAHSGATNGDNVFCCDITSQTFLGNHRLYTVKANDAVFLAEAPVWLKLQGQAYFRIPRSSVVLFLPSTS